MQFNCQQTPRRACEGSKNRPVTGPSTFTCVHAQVYDMFDVHVIVKLAAILLRHVNDILFSYDYEPLIRIKTNHMKSNPALQPPRE